MSEEHPCPTCEDSFDTEAGMKKHHALAHGESLVPEGEHDCLSCDRSFDTELGMKQHHAKVHGGSPAYKTVECAECGDEVERLASRLKNRENVFCSNECQGLFQATIYTLECEACGKEFERTSTDMTDGPDYCSIQCVGKGKRTASGDIIDVQCDECGQIFERERYMVERSERNFCSRECYGEAMKNRVELECDTCGGKFERRKSEADKSERKYCSRICLYRGMVGEGHPRWSGASDSDMINGEVWAKRRAEAVSRDGNECYICGLSDQEHRTKFGQKIHVHHVTPRREFITDGEWSLEDLLEANALDNLVTVCASCHRDVEGLSWDEIEQLASLPADPEIQRTITAFGGED